MPILSSNTTNNSYRLGKELAVFELGWIENSLFDQFVGEAYSTLKST